MLAVIGENIIDLVPLDAPGRYQAHAGGSPANTAVAAARLGSPSALIARVSGDVFGHQVRARLAACGVDDRYLVPAVESSSLAVVTFDAERRATYDFWLAGTADWQWSDDELPDPLDAEVTAVHVGSLAAFVEPGASAIERLLVRERQGGRVTISLDPNVRPAIIGDLGVATARVERLVALSDVVKASEEDLHTLYPGRRAEESARAWLAAGPALVIVTRGGEGAFAVTAAGSLTVAAPAIELADTVGAGDTFSGALLHALSEADLLGNDTLGSLGAAELRPILEAATAAAALNCTRHGANPPTAAELAAFLRARRSSSGGFSERSTASTL